MLHEPQAAMEPRRILASKPNPEQGTNEIRGLRPRYYPRTKTTVKHAIAYVREALDTGSDEAYEHTLGDSARSVPLEPCTRFGGRGGLP